MPNWVSNNVSITAKSKSDLDVFLEKAKGADSKIKEDEREFHFGAFVHPSDEDVPYYKGELKDEKPEGWDELSSAEQLAHNLKFSGRDWYDWNVTNWGTKWDACETYVSRESDLSVSVGFQTAWGIPEPLLRAMTEQHPELNFSVWAEEEQGWGAEYVGANGELITTDEWDIPNSHADYAKRDREDSCVCSYEDDKEEWYDDCPNKQDIFVQVTKVYRLSSGNLDDARVEYFQMETGRVELPTEEEALSSFVFVDEDGKPIED
jgi:hypothetical protein